MGRRNWCQVDWNPKNGELVFDLRVEKEKGVGTTVGYVVDSELRDGDGTHSHLLQLSHSCTCAQLAPELNFLRYCDPA